MDIRWKNISHFSITKIIVFIIVITCFTGAITVFFNMIAIERIDPEILLQDSYYESSEFGKDMVKISYSLMDVFKLYKNEDEERAVQQDISEEQAEDYRNNEIDLIQKNLKKITGLKYYMNFNGITFTNSDNTNMEYFKKDSAYILIDEETAVIYPAKITDNESYDRFIGELYYLQENDSIIYISFTDEYLKPKIEKWNEEKEIAKSQSQILFGCLIGLIISFIYLLFTIGRNSFKDKEVHMNSLDRLYNDINIALCIAFISLWFIIMETIFNDDLYYLIAPITATIGSFGLLLVLSLVKHIKNRTIIRHTLLFTIINKIFKFAKEVYESGSTGTKIVLIVIFYPIVVVMSLFIFPVTIGFAGWLALKRVKEFNAIKEGVKRVKAGELNYKIDIQGSGEFSNLAADINTITEGLNNAVESELKSERLKTELITNVSHDIRTPLTSIITYIDLLKKENDEEKAKEYIEVLEKKSQRLKELTDDLFEAAKASSGSVTVNFENIDIVSLLKQGLGELDDKINEMELDFRINYPKEKVYVKADGALLWRVIENLLSNIFKYALKGSRVYIDIEDKGNEVSFTMKNISAYELNIPAEELIERFKRGDESRNSSGSGLGLSIAKSLVEVQKGSFKIEIDGDLFKAIINLPKYQ